MIPVYENRPVGIDAFLNRRLDFPAHLHAELELFYVQQGSICVNCGEESREMQTGELAVIAPNVIHTYRMPRQEDGQFLLAICPVEMLGEIRFERQVPRTPFLPARLVHPHVAFAMQALPGQQNRAVCSALVQLVLAHALPHLNLARAGTPPADRLARLVTYIAAHQHEPLTLDSVARQMEMSPSALSRMFSQQLGTGFCAYLGGLRVRRAQMLLRTTGWDISAVAAACGFETLRTFDRTFARHTGMTPRQYRRENTAGMQKGEEV